MKWLRSSHRVILCLSNLSFVRQFRKGSALISELNGVYFSEYFFMLAVKLADAPIMWSELLSCILK